MESLLAGVHSLSPQVLASVAMAFFSRLNRQIQSLLKGPGAEPVAKRRDAPSLESTRSEQAPYREKSRSGGGAEQERGARGARDLATRNRLLGQPHGGVAEGNRPALSANKSQGVAAAGRSNDSVGAIFHSLVIAQNALGAEALSLRMEQLGNRSDPAKHARLLANREQQARNRAVLEGLILVGQQKIEQLTTLQAGGRPLSVAQNAELANHRLLDIEMRLMRRAPY
jgi:hypothetical protein